MNSKRCFMSPSPSIVHAEQNDFGPAAEKKKFIVPLRVPRQISINHKGRKTRRDRAAYRRGNRHAGYDRSESSAGEERSSLLEQLLEEADREIDGHRDLN